MIHTDPQNDTGRPQAAGELVRVLDRLSLRDQHIVARLAQRLAMVERTLGEDAALAAAERIEMIVRGGRAL